MEPLLETESVLPRRKMSLHPKSVTNSLLFNSRPLSVAIILGISNNPTYVTIASTISLAVFYFLNKCIFTKLIYEGEEAFSVQLK